MPPRSGTPFQILADLRDRGAQTRGDLALNLPESTGNAILAALDRMRHAGLIEVAYLITDAGLDALALAEQQDTPVRPAPRPLREQPDYPLAATDAQITALKREAEEHRSFGYTSINQRNR
jgi:hypothetical protein